MSARVRNVGIKTWTEADVERLKFLWAEGFSGSVIGKELGRTRNSVIGRVFRMKLKTENHPVNHHKLRVKREVRAKKVIRRMKRNEPPKSKRHPTRPVMDGRTIPTIAIDVSSLKGRAWEPLPDTTPKLLHELGTRDCRWSVSDTVHIFCAEPTSRDYGYCPTHSAMAFKPLPVKA